ncbi:MAG: DedA family protein, partial [Chloroflexota bacterium]|nr:DedA family protein [Chloroflexota bacterium]
MSRFLDWLATVATDVIEALGYPGVALLIFLENVFPPIPSEAILPLAGFLAGQGRMWLPAVIVAATIGAVAGALVLYALGAWFGDSRIRWLVNRYGKWLAITEDDLDLANGWFDRHGGKAVLLCRLVPIVRSIISIPAGLRRMSLPVFILYTAIGSGLWNSILVLGGWWLGENWEEVGHYVSYLEYPVIIVVILAVAWYIWKRVLAKPRSSKASPA